MQLIQVIGDSMVKRLQNHVLGNPTSTLHISHSIGLSGATIKELKSFLKYNPPQLDPKIPLLIFIGTNNIFRDTPLSVMQDQIISLIKFIRRTNPQIRIILTQLPLYPRAQHTAHWIAAIDQFNKFLHSLQNSSTQFFKLQNFLGSSRNFQLRYKHNGRPDGIHFNNLGNQKFIQHLLPIIQQ